MQRDAGNHLNAGQEGGMSGIKGNLTDLQAKSWFVEAITMNIFLFKYNNFYLESNPHLNELRAFNVCWLITPPNNLAIRERELPHFTDGETESRKGCALLRTSLQRVGSSSPAAPSHRHRAPVPDVLWGKHSLLAPGEKQPPSWDYSSQQTVGAHSRFPNMEKD